jgi:predicted DCC family thiol-disulfide oxidoreductase YuxK
MTGMKRPRFPITIFYDGACIVCATEIEHYRKKDLFHRLILVDISDAEFDPAAHDKSRQDFMSQLHVLDAEGNYYLAVDAFLAIWSALPGRLYRFLAFTVTLPGVHLLAKGGYRFFAKNRKYFPRRKKYCESDRCSLGHLK